DHELARVVGVLQSEIDADRGRALADTIFDQNAAAIEAGAARGGHLRRDRDRRTAVIGEIAGTLVGPVYRIVEPIRNKAASVRYAACGDAARRRVDRMRR